MVSLVPRCSSEVSLGIFTERTSDALCSSVSWRVRMYLGGMGLYTKFSELCRTLLD